ncbi:membrane protein insertion efficiency factor YidD [Geothrix sp.]|uniref:membrane protein insertion efficiency factor YidD n=2 Tax=Geothrix sp. TaxID=1962974 RepID=UPI00341DB2F4
MRQRRLPQSESLPPSEEQRLAEEYCCTRPLNRPDSSLLRAGIVSLIFFVVGSTFSFVLFFLLKEKGYFLYLPKPLNSFASMHPVWWRCFFWLAINGVGFVIWMRKALIGIIRLYQRYAPEDVRRRCLFMPTCSEYAILVLQKHGVIIGLLMIFDRLWYRCRGTIYRIDYP